MNESNEANAVREPSDEVSPTPMGTSMNGGKRKPSVTMNEIHRLAYSKWNAAGRPMGDTTHFWLEAERELVEVT